MDQNSQRFSLFLLSLSFVSLFHSQEHEASLVPHSVCSVRHLTNFLHKFVYNSKRFVEHSDYQIIHI